MSQVESTEAVETGESSAEAAPVEDSAPVEAAESVEAEPVEEAESVIDWNGEVTDLKQAEWYSQMDPELRDSMLRGIENKYRNWQRGYTDKFQEMSGQRKALDRREHDIREQERRVQKWLHGDIDPLEAKQREIDDMKLSHNSAVSALQREYAENMEKAKTATDSEYRKLLEERNELSGKFEQIETERAAAHEAHVENLTNEFEQWITNTAPDVIANDEAFYALCANCTAGFPREKSLAMVRAIFPAPAPPPEPEEVPEGMKLMNMGTGLASGTEVGESRQYHDIMEQMRRSAQADAASFFNKS